MKHKLYFIKAMVWKKEKWSIFNELEDYISICVVWVIMQTVVLFYALTYKLL